MNKEQHDRLLKLRAKKKLSKGEAWEKAHLERVLEKYGYKKKI